MTRVSNEIKAALTGLILLVGAACGGFGSSAPGVGAARPCQVQGSNLTSSTHSYTMSLVTGSPERMYSAGEAAKQHPMEGEVMLRGTMSGGGGATHDMGSMGDVGSTPSSGGATAASATLRHVEVHICSRATGEVISDAEPTMAILDLTTGQTDYLPVAVMQSVTSGPADLHYGNNVEFPAGHQLSLRVTLGGEDAQFRLQP